ncbi:MAG: nucleoside-diphosphate sugar epimerase/dehydratase [Chromatiaceae bacterium]
MSRWFERLRSRSAAFIHDLVMLPVAWLLAFWLRFNLGDIPDEQLNVALLALPILLVAQGTLNWLLGLYRGVWRFASLPDLIRISKAVLTGTGLTFFLLFVFNRLDAVPRSVPPLYLLLQLVLLAGPRLIYRWLKDHRLNLGDGQRVLIVGAERPGEMLARDMLRDPRRAYIPVAFVDDRPRRHGADVHGIPVRGGTEDIPALALDLDIDLILLATPDASASEMQRLVDLCERAGPPFRTVPHLSNLMNGQVSINQVRPVSIEDLLGRDPVALDSEALRQGLTGRRILVTGGGGSIGSELCRQIARASPAALIVADHSEYNLYHIDRELRQARPDLEMRCRLVDVTDAEAVAALFARERPEILFHAAAYKHVPLLEDQVRAAVRNNILGTQILATAADRWEVDRFILISTDKAVNPANIMGATKRVAERLCQALDTQSRTRFIAVRFGNVLGSAGSVVPLFRSQIEQGGPLTLTHPDMERFFMTIPEACQLIMQAATIGCGGEIFVLDMGAPVSIRYLAEQMIRLSGHQPGQDIAIEYIGLRPGEKLFEELFYPSEGLGATAHPKIHVAHAPPEAVPGVLKRALDDLEVAVTAGNEATLRSILLRLAPPNGGLAQAEQRPETREHA